MQSAGTGSLGTGMTSLGPSRLHLRGLAGVPAKSHFFETFLKNMTKPILASLGPSSLHLWGFRGNLEKFSRVLAEFQEFYGSFTWIYWSLTGSWVKILEFKKGPRTLVKLSESENRTHCFSLQNQWVRFYTSVALFLFVRWPFASHGLVYVFVLVCRTLLRLSQSG